MASIIVRKECIVYILRIQMFDVAHLVRDILQLACRSPVKRLSFYINILVTRSALLKETTVVTVMYTHADTRACVRACVYF